jgi:hypothetical protein
MEVEDMKGNVQHEFECVTIIIGDNKYRLKESYGKLNINKTYLGGDWSDTDIEALAVYSRSTNEIEIK